MHRPDAPAAPMAFAVLAALATGAPAPARAITYCVGNGSQLQAALTAAEDNHQDDTIRLRAGVYSGTGTFEAFDYWSEQGHDLTLIGGWNAGCTARSAATPTQLDGEDARGVMRLFSGGEGNEVTLTVQWLQFERGVALGSGGGLRIGGAAGNTTHVVVEHVHFLANTAGEFGGGLSATGNGDLWLRNNLFVGNHAALGSGAATLTSNGGVAVINSNTVLANTAGGANPTGGLAFNGSATLLVANNILSGNQGRDLFVGASVTHQRQHNTIGQLTAPTPLGLAAEITTAPVFMAGIFNLDPRTGGAQYNGGHPAPLGGLTDVDLDGRPRVAGGRVDMGAYESAVLFYDGFDRHPAN